MALRLHSAVPPLCQRTGPACQRALPLLCLCWHGASSLLHTVKLHKLQRSLTARIPFIPFAWLRVRVCMVCACHASISASARAPCSCVPAALGFTNGDIHVSTQGRLVEYGGTLDACCKFSLLLEAQAAAGNAPAVLMQVDQFGVLHAPFAQGRAFMHEFGYDDVIVPVHTASGSVDLITVANLAPCTYPCTAVFTQAVLVK